MKMPAPAVDYRQLRPSNLTSETYRHLLLLLYWPFYGLTFLYLERFYQPAGWHVMHCALDDRIPFLEWFLIPYLFWFLYLGGMVFYTLFMDIPAFRALMRFIILTCSVTMVIYFLWPTCQELRPDSFARDNLLTRFMAAFYRFDTNTNVCPSIHVLSSLGVIFAGLQCQGLQTAPRKAALIITGLLVCLSTVFLKQHSVLDVLAALPLSLIGWYLCFYLPDRRQGYGHNRQHRQKSRPCASA